MQELELHARMNGWEVLFLRKGLLEFKAKGQQSFADLFSQVMAVAMEVEEDRAMRREGVDILDFIQEKAEEAAKEELEREEEEEEEKAKPKETQFRDPSSGKHLN